MSHKGQTHQPRTMRGGQDSPVKDITTEGRDEGDERVKTQRPRTLLWVKDSPTKDITVG